MHKNVIFGYERIIYNLRDYIRVFDYKTSIFNYY